MQQGGSPVFRREQVEPSTTSAGPTPVAKIETIVGPNAHFKGDVQSDGGVRIEGIFEGSLDITGNLVVGEGAKVIADVKANNISISGAVKGNIAGNRVEILETGRVWGDLSIKSLLLNEGAYLRGQTTMQGDIQPPMIEPPKPQQPASPGKATIVDVEAKPSRAEQEEV
jgi:cytoskeletal protein CcmA (bactofilin family)